MRIAYLYSFATLSDDELERYTRFVESDNVKWMYGMVRQGILAGSETFGREVATRLAQLSKPASPSLASPAEGRSPQELYEQGVRLIDGGNEQEATRFLDAAIRLKPDYAIAYYKRGNAYRDMDKASEAVDNYTQASGVHGDVDPARSSKLTWVRCSSQASAKLSCENPGDVRISRILAPKRV